MKTEDFCRRISEIIDIAQNAIKQRINGEYSSWIPGSQFSSFRSGSLSLLVKLFGDQHPYYTEFYNKVQSSDSSHIELGIGILHSAREELLGGWLVSVKGLLSAEIFSDFLEMADYLLSENYKDPAAVVAGSSLEEHLRQLSIRHSISLTIIKGDSTVPKRADTLNADLTAINVYSKLEQKNVTAWLALRNKAAHGKYVEYDSGQVRLMIEGIRQFISRTTD